MLEKDGIIVSVPKEGNTLIDVTEENRNLLSECIDVSADIFKKLTSVNPLENINGAEPTNLMEAVLYTKENLNFLRQLLHDINSKI